MEKDIILLSFVCAKSRVAHLRKTTIPRFELLTCCIGARCSAIVIKALDLKNIPIFYWSASSTALYWIEDMAPRVRGETDNELEYGLEDSKIQS
ncbi:hypothetical protein NPIL_627201 [Nephila pilipes]|uniref:Uncharacterized protein n=1 Tax=Nephila pilipes TaxID=299642 RepID=A0A8X6TB04_NEPPI|nr:hypothetical protein NPIL_627201 [Nephila pilipes]